MRPDRPRPVGRLEAFSLLELLVVVLLIAVLSSLTVPAVASIKRGTDLQTAAARTFEQFQMSRQASCVKNRPVEMRIYPSDKLAQNRATIQIFTIEDDGSAKAASKREVLPEAIVISEDATLSDLLKGKTNDPARGDYYGFRYSAGGFPSATVTATPPVLTLMARSDALKDPTGLPANFVTIQIEPQTGNPRLYRP